MFEVGKFYVLMNGDVGECVSISGDAGLRMPVTLFFEDEKCYRTYTLDGFYFGIHRHHALDVVGPVKRKMDIETFGKKVAKRIMEIIEEEVERHKEGSK